MRADLEDSSRRAGERAVLASEGEAGRYTFDADAPFGLPYRPTPFHAQITLGFAGDALGEDVTEGLPVQYRYEGNIFSGEKRTELLVVPAFSVRVSPEIAIVPVSSLPALPTAGGPTRPVSRRPFGPPEGPQTVP